MLNPFPFGVFIAAALAVASPSPRPAIAVDPPAAATTTKSTPEFEAFRHAWADVVNYTTTIVAHESTNDGKTVDDRTFVYKFVKPNNALISVISGPGKGGGAAWHGGATVRAHKGGFGSFIKLTLAEDDPRVTSLRGDRIEVASFGYVVEHFATVPGSLSEAKAATGTTVTLSPATPEPSGITREVITLSPTTHLPIKHEAFVGERTVKSETFGDVRVNDPQLTARNIDI